jgi:hypothetical protein
MPHASLKLVPGVDQNRTPALNEAAISESNLIRFIPDRSGLGLPQKLGGWTRYFNQPMTAIVRALWAWADTNDNRYLAVGSEDGVYTIENSGLTDLSPQTYTANPPMSFSTTSGSNEVFIDDVGSNVSSFDSIFLSTHVSVGGLILFGFYSCEALTSDEYSIFARNVIGLPQLATSTVTGGGDVAVFDTTIDEPSISVTLDNHGFSVGSTFPILVSTTVGGLTLYGNYIVQTVVSANEFTISAENSASSTASASINGGDPRIIYYVGKVAPPPATGYGAGGYGAGGYGTGVTASGNRSFATTNATSSGTTATVSFSGSYAIPVGSLVTVSGVTPSGYNGTWITTAYTQGATSTVSFTIPSTLGNQTVAGTLTVTDWNFGTATDWSLDNWGEYLIASPRGREIFFWNPTDGGSYSSVVPNAPKANEGCFVAMPQRQIIAYGSTFNGIQDPLLIRWCDIGNFTVWTGTVANQAGSFRIPKGSKIVGAMQAPQQGLIWTDLGVWSMQYISQPFIWSFNEIGTGCGLIGQKAVAAINGNVFWMSQSQFFTLSAGGAQPVPCPIWDVIFQDIDMSYADRIRCATNARFGEVAWYYPTMGSNGVPTKYVKFNLQVGSWDFGELTRTAWIDQSVLGAPIGAGGDRFIYQHETSTDAVDPSGQPMAMTSYVQTGYFALADGDLKTFVDQVWPDMKWGYYDGVQSANVQITFYVADYPGQEPTVHGPYTVTEATTYITPRIRGRLVSIRVGSNDVGSFWRLGNIRYRLQPDGKF